MRAAERGRRDAATSRSCSANRTMRIARDAHLAPAHRMRVEQQQATAEGFADSGNYFQGFGGLGGADAANERSKNAHDRAARFFKLSAFAEQAVVARSFGVAGVEDLHLPVEADRRTRHQRLVRSPACAVCPGARREIL